MSDPSVADKLGGVAKLWGGPLLAADLQYATRATNRVAKRPALGDRQRSRLLEVHILACLDRMDRRNSVPVVGSADDDRVDFFIRQHLTIVSISGHAVVALTGLLGVIVVDQLSGFLDPVTIQIADRDDPGIVML